LRSERLAAIALAVACARKPAPPIPAAPAAAALHDAAVTVRPDGARPPGQLAVERYFARRTHGRIKIDGKLDERAWKAAPVSDLFVDPSTGRPAGERTEVRLLWDERNLYLAFFARDRDISAEGDTLEVLLHDRTSRGSHLWLRVTAGGGLVERVEPQGAAAALAAVAVHDQSWSAEVAVPLSALAAVSDPVHRHRPRWGDLYSLNVFRVDAAAGRPPVESVWSRMFDHDVHALDQSGDLIFANEAGEHPADVIEREEEAEERRR